MAGLKNEQNSFSTSTLPPPLKYDNFLVESYFEFARFVLSWRHNILLLLL